VARGPEVSLLVERDVAALGREHGGDLISGIAALLAAVRNEAEQRLAAARDGAGAGAPLLRATVGIGVPAIVRADGSLRAELPFGLPAGTELRDRLRSELGTEVVVDNDASLAALGEAHHGAGGGEPTVVLVTLGTNIGMGVVVDGEIYRGVHGAAGELGTVALPLASFEVARWRQVHDRRRRSSAAPPADGYALLEELYGGQALSEAWFDAARQAEATGSDVVPGTSAGARVLALATAGDAVADRLVDEALSGWAFAIAAVVNILDPGAVLIGGGIASDIGPFLDVLRSRVDGLLPGRAAKLAVATLGPSAGLIGAAVAAGLHDRAAARGSGPATG
jgi:glucokinase